MLKFKQNEPQLILLWRQQTTTKHKQNPSDALSAPSTSFTDFFCFNSISQEPHHTVILFWWGFFLICIIGFRLFF